MARRSRGYLAKCPTFLETPRTEGRQQQCYAEKGGYRFRIVRYKKTGRLVAWLIPPRSVRNKAGYRGMELPVSTPQTRSLNQLLDAAVRFVKRVPRQN